MKKLISIVLPCYNEEENLHILYDRLTTVTNKLDKYDFEFIFVDNCSTDSSVKIIEDKSLQDNKVRAIINAGNYGSLRSPFHGLTEATGDAVILMATDLQDPPELLPELIHEWETNSYYVVAAVKSSSKESKVMYAIRSIYYKCVKFLSENEQIEHFTGFGLYDKKVIQVLKEIKDPYPYLRGLVTELGFKVKCIEFNQPARQRGITKNNFLSLYDFAILGIVSQSKLPLRLLTIVGFALAIISLFMSFTFVVLKLIFWNHFPSGIIPILCALLFFTSVQLFFIGLLGEYIMLIYTKVSNRPLVVEDRRINYTKENNI